MSNARHLGWAPLWRALLDSEDWKTAATTAKVVMVVIILRIRHLATPATPAGCWDTKLDALADHAGISRRAAQLALKQLTDGGWCVVKRRQSGMRIEVPSWERWRRRGAENALSDAQETHYLDPESPESDAQDSTYQIGGNLRIPPYREEDQEDLSSRGVVEPVEASPPPTRQITDAFQSRYESAYGRKPTWNGRTGKQVQALLKQHGLPRVLEAVETLFSNPPRFLDPPYDFGTLVQHFDKLLPVANGGQRGSAPRGGMSAQDIFRRAAELDRRDGQR